MALFRNLAGWHACAVWLAVGWLCAVTPAHAQVTWSGTGSSSSWSTSGNWSTALGNNFSAALVFDGTNNLTNTNDRTSGTATSITFNAGAGAFTIGGQAINLGGNITNNSSVKQTINNDLSIAATRTLTGTLAGGELVLGGNISGAGGLATGNGPSVGTSTLTLSGSNSFQGNVTTGQRINLNINHAYALGSGNSLSVRNTGTVSNTSGVDLQLSGRHDITISGNDGSATFTLPNSLDFGDSTFYYSKADAFSLTVNGAGTLTLGSLTPATGSLSATFTKSNAGGLTLRNAAATGMVGAVTLSAGMVQLGHDRSLGDGAIAFNGATLQSLNGSRTLSNTVSIGGASASIVSGTNSFSFSGAITGASGNPRALSNNLATNALLTIANLGLNAETGTLRTLTISGSGNTLITGTISDGNASRAHNLTIDNTGITTISGTSTYGGTTQVNAGTLVFRSTEAKAAGTVTVAAAGSIGLGVGGSGYYSSSDVAALFGNTLSGFTMNASSGVAVDTTAGDFTISNALAGSRAFRKLGANTLSLSTANTYSGTTSIAAGALRAAHAFALGGTSAGTVVASGAALELSNNVAIGAEALSLAGTGVSAGGALRNVSGNNSFAGDITGAAAFSIRSDAGVLTLSGGNTSAFDRTFGGAGDIKVTGAFSGAGAVIKVGSGALTLNGTNTYEGTTKVEAGTLVVNGSLGSGNLTVQSGATLKGNGTVNGFTTIDGIHSPGNSPGLETFTNGLSYGSASLLVWELSANTALASARGSLYDGIDLAGGALSIAPGATLNLVFDAALAGGGSSTVDWDDPFWASSQTWKVIDVQSGVWTPGVFTLGSIGVDASGQAFTSSIRSAATFSVSQSTDGSIYVNYVIVPEPTAWAMAGVGAAVLAWSCQQRRRRKP